MTAAPSVLFVTGEYPPLPGGVGDYTACLRDTLATLGLRTSVLTLTGAHGEHVHTVTRWGWRTNYGRQIAADRANIVHIQYQAGAFAMHPSINLLPLLLERRVGVPTVTTFHDLRPPYLFLRARRLRRRLMRSLATRSAAVVVTNLDDERALAAQGVPAARIAIGPNLPLPAEQVGLPDRHTVAFFGFPARSKGLEELLLALGSIEASRRPTLKLVGAQGARSRNSDQLTIAEIDALAARESVKLERTGYLSPQAASDTLALVGAIVLPYRDGASLRNGSLLAALQTGQPVISTLPENVEALGSLARLPQLTLVPTGAPGALATAIEAGLAQLPCSAGLPDEFHWNTIAQRHAKLYADVLLRAGAAS